MFMKSLIKFITCNDVSGCQVDIYMHQSDLSSWVTHQPAMYPGLLPPVYVSTVTHLDVRWMFGGVANLKAVLCLDVGDAVITVDWERVGVMGG